MSNEKSVKEMNTSMAPEIDSAYCSVEPSDWITGKRSENFSCSHFGSRVIARVPRVIRNGKVAVIYQPHRGLGWFSEHRIEALLFAPEIVELIEHDAPGSKIYEYCQKKNYGWRVMDTICYGLSIQWVPLSEEFRVHESDDRETIVFKSTDHWFKA